MSAKKLTRADLRARKAERASANAVSMTRPQRLGNIAGFADQATQAIFHNRVGDVRGCDRLHPSLWPVAQRKLDLLCAAQKPSDLRYPAGNDLKHLRRHKRYSGYWSVRVNQQHRLLFKFEAGTFTDVLITDPHRG